MAVLFPSSEISIVSGFTRTENLIKRFSKQNPNNCRSLKDKDKAEIRFSRVKVTTCSSPKDCEVRVSDYGKIAGISREFSAPVKHRQSKEDEEKQNYYVNTGYAIRTLREEFPAIFYKEPSFDIYRDDIVFKDPLNIFIGIDNYKSIFWALRFHGRIFFKALWIDIVGVWQPFDNVIMVRWTVHGIPRVPWEARGRFDGTSEYKLDKNGKIFEHRVDNVALNSPPKFKVLSVDDLIQSLGCPSTPKPTYFEISPFICEIHAILDEVYLGSILSPFL